MVSAVIPNPGQASLFCAFICLITALPSLQPLVNSSVYSISVSVSCFWVHQFSRQNDLANRELAYTHTPSNKPSPARVLYWDNMTNSSGMSLFLATSLDNHLWECHRERITHPPRLATSWLSLPPAARTSLSPPSAPRVTPGPATSTTLGEELIQLGWALFSPADCLQRMRVGECLYCSQSDHFLAICPLWPKGGGAHQ